MEIFTNKLDVFRFYILDIYIFIYLSNDGSTGLILFISASSPCILLVFTVALFILLISYSLPVVNGIVGTDLSTFRIVTGLAS